MLKEFIKKLGIPDSCLVNNKVFKKLFYEKGDIKYHDKKIFIDDIEQINWLYTLKEATISIKAYQEGNLDYSEIAVLLVNLSKDNRYERIADIIQRTVPYPIILLFKYQNNLLINVTYKRVNQLEEDKATYEELIFTKWIDLNKQGEIEEDFIKSLTIKNLSYHNFYEFYKDFADRIIAYNIACITGDFVLEKHQQLNRSKKTLEKLLQLEDEREKLKKMIKKESQFNRKVDLNMKYKKVEKQINKLKDIL